MSGAGQGIGFAGARIVLNGRSEAKLEAAVTQLAADDIESSFAAFDVFDPQAVWAASSRSKPRSERSVSSSPTPVSGTESCREIFPSKEARADANQSR